MKIRIIIQPFGFFVDLERVEIKITVIFTFKAMGTFITSGRICFGTEESTSMHQ